MSCHSCSDLCHLDDRIHELIKSCGPHEAWHPDREELLVYLAELIAIVAKREEPVR